MDPKCQGKCQNNGRPDMTDRRWHPEMMDRRRHVRRRQLPESQSTGSRDSLPSFPLGESLRPVVYRENVLPSTMYQSINSLSSSLSIPIFQQVMRPDWTLCQSDTHHYRTRRSYLPLCVRLLRLIPTLAFFKPQLMEPRRVRQHCQDGLNQTTCHVCSAGLYNARNYRSWRTT